MTSSPPAGSLWTIIVPVKLTAYAKTRLTGYDQIGRRALAVAFALDTVGAAIACREVATVVVVTNDEVADRFRALGVRVVPDEPDSGLNPALVYAAGRARRDNPGAAVAAISSDLPSLRGEDLSAAIRASPVEGGWFVADSQGVGTTMLAAPAGTPWQPRFGPHSRAAHRADGLTEVEAAGLQRLRRDVDTPVDLWDALRLGVGPATREALAGLHTR